jgi:hypothetical protein
MTTLVTADHKGRLRIRGVKSGRTYVVAQEPGGWWITTKVETSPSRNRNYWTGSKCSLLDHLNALSDAGLAIEVSEVSKKHTSPCPF